MSRLPSLGIVTVATNQYIEYWKNQATSVAAAKIDTLDVTLHVFTDNHNSVEEFCASLSVKVVFHKISNLGWPEASLYRYDLIRQFKESIREDFIMHLDADMLIHEKIDFLNIKRDQKNGLTLVRHPGYFRPTGLRLVKLYLSHPLKFFKDAVTIMRLGGLGSWETRQQSLAYVPRSARGHYFCGGTWWGTRLKILELCEELAERIIQDEKNGLTAVWHDESHINWWASRNTVGVADPRYCFAEGYPQLLGIPRIIEAVRK
jgi:hypothetical protein